MAEAEAPPTDPALIITDAMIAVDHQVTHLPPKTALELLEFCRRRLDATEARILADRYENGATDRDVEDMAKGTDGKTSKAAAKTKARRAKATNANPDLADRLANGTMSTEQADIIAQAAEDTDGEAACDQELIDAISETNPEQGKKKAREFVNKRTNPDDVQKRFDRQHRKRGVYRHRLDNGNDAITFHGPTEHIDDIERNIHAVSNDEYDADGSRDLPNSEHPRTHDQRNFDAAHKLLTGTPTNDSTDTAPSRRPKRGRRQATIFITATIDQLTGTDPTPITGIDGKPLPRSYIENLAGDAAFIAQIFSAGGELLWQGRQTRLATPAQIKGLISRDKGCVQCGADVTKCVAHHLLPWEAPRKGPTNINNLALVCTDCHVRLHRNRQTLYYDLRTQTWKIRPARPDEIPPDPGGHHHRPPAPTRRTQSTYAHETQAPTPSKPTLFDRPPLPGLRPSTTGSSN